ncbi:LicD family-domain-containing protein [Rhexocercosporidium sp. MPI-PUGE-AT-0058]|nr:LicD family-domain-containing protein [Rhexocercosporidium sp. MPI-PUGE-AT-0058]
MRRQRLRWLLLLVPCVFVYHTTKTESHSLQPLRAPEPMSNTYQYFTEIDVYSKSKLVGAISHVDSRFGLRSEPLGVNDLQSTLVALFKSYTKTMEDLGIETWLAHGTLLGHHWGRKILPWDTDIDVQVSMTTLRYLATKYNGTQYQHKSSTYLLDINPHYSIVSTADVSNKIDARWIDMNCGKYIDITSVHQNESTPSLLFCKDHHQYTSDEIYPLQPSIFEGVKVNIPIQAEDILSKEYGQNALVKSSFHWYKWDSKSQRWNPKVAWWTFIRTFIWD